jgi:hypothetical protein
VENHLGLGGVDNHVDDYYYFREVCGQGRLDRGGVGLLIFI